MHSHRHLQASRSWGCYPQLPAGDVYHVFGRQSRLGQFTDCFVGFLTVAFCEIIHL